MVETDVRASATRADEPETTGLKPVALQAGLELRVVRLEHLLSAFGLLLERFQGAGAVLGATVFDNFDDPAAGNDALDALFESSMDARRDLNALRRDVPNLVMAPESIAGSQLLARLGLLGASATELAGRFEQYRGSMSPAVPPRSPGGVGRLDQFVAIAVRALLDIAEVMEGLQPSEVRSGLVASAPARPHLSPASPPERHRSSVAALGMPVAGALWQLVRRRRTRLMVEFAGVAVVGMVVLVSALEQSGRTPGFLGDYGSASGAPGRTGDTGVAVGGSPSGSPAPGASPEPGPSGAPPAPGQSSPVPAPPPRVTPRPTHAPAPTPKPASAATRFNDRIVTATGSIDGLLGTITTAVQDSDLPEAKAAADKIASIAITERSWLLSHPATACYKPFYDSAFATYGELIVTASAIASDADAGNGNVIHKEVASAHGDVSALKQAGNKAVTACA